ncbi:MAG TPA: hypothetical protein VFV41_22755 [Streptosporangiaceae bacterium]|nr:hypothetical protein [Streptosporangiaceae bacterium]
MRAGFFTPQEASSSRQRREAGNSAGQEVLAFRDVDELVSARN